MCQILRKIGDPNSCIDPILNQGLYSLFFSIVVFIGGKKSPWTHLNQWPRSPSNSTSGSKMLTASRRHMAAIPQAEGGKGQAKRPRMWPVDSRWQLQPSEKSLSCHFPDRAETSRLADAAVRHYQIIQFQWQKSASNGCCIVKSLLISLLRFFLRSFKITWNEIAKGLNLASAPKS